VPEQTVVPGDTVTAPGTGGVVQGGGGVYVILIVGRWLPYIATSALLTVRGELLATPSAFPLAGLI
jgi:hypothetical protein